MALLPRLLEVRLHVVIRGTKINVPLQATSVFYPFTKERDAKQIHPLFWEGAPIPEYQDLDPPGSVIPLPQILRAEKY